MKLFVILLFVLGCGSSPAGPRLQSSQGDSPGKRVKSRARAGQSAQGASSERELLSERECARALYPRLDAERGIADPEHPRHAIGKVTIHEFGDTDHACLVTLERSRETTADMNPDEMRDIEGTAEIIYDVAVLTVRKGEVSVRARTRDMFSISAPGIGYADEVHAAVELQAIWVISENDDAILIHAWGSASSESIGGNEISGEYNYTESGGRDHYVLYRLVGGKLDPVLTVQVESATMVDASAPSAQDGQTVLEGEAGLDILDTETNGYIDVEVHTRMTRTEGDGEPEVTELIERYVWDGERYVRAAE